MNVRSIASALPFALVASNGLGISVSSSQEINSLLPASNLGDAQLNCNVNLTNGNLTNFDKEFSFTDQGSLIEFCYVYNSLAENKWQLAYGRSITNNNENILVTEADGSKINYIFDAETNSYFPEEYTDSRKCLKVNEEGYTLFDPNTNIQEIFNSSGQLKKRISSEGNETKFEYNENKLSAIIAPSQTKYEFDFKEDNKIEINRRISGGDP